MTVKGDHKEPLLIDINGATELLGVDKGYIRWLVRERRIPFKRPGGGRRIFFSPSELRDWAERDSVPVYSESRNEGGRRSR